MQLAESIALVTGGARRLGAAMARALAAHGVHVALHCHTSHAAAEALAAELRTAGAVVEVFSADLRRASDVEALFEAVKNRFGALHILVNNAAVFERRPFLELTDADWEQTLAVNLTAPFWCARRAAALMTAQGRGKIINIACVGGVRPWTDYIHYNVSKAGLIMLTESMAKALAPVVQVNAIAPGRVDFTAARRGVTPDDITQALLYLLQADAVTGETLFVDAGYRLGLPLDRLTPPTET
ncbi:MAG: SDR family oxidoreductase [Chloracidobacterium sp.]|nr:SDR family oxidoreductase [Chloracidobacterium sp.]MDW8217771.1 SDR family oxidoreductase [Acidobacteriota bacterium]